MLFLNSVLKIPDLGYFFVDIKVLALKYCEPYQFLA